MASDVVNPFGPSVRVPDTNSNSNHTLLNGARANSEALVPPPPNVRIHGVTVFRPIIYGNVSYRLPRPPSRNQRSGIQDDNQDWFRWTVYVRGIENEDLSYLIKKVVFYLHESYDEPIRVIENGPFELTEEGWGQFEIKIEIYFHDIAAVEDNIKSTKRGDENAMDVDTEENESKIKRMVQEKAADLEQIIPSCYDDANENKIAVIHALRLFAKDSSEDSKKGIIEETFVEIEFIDPYYSTYQRLMIGPHKLMKKHPFMEHWKNRAIDIATNEQLLIQKISLTHRDLLKKMKLAHQEYKTLCKNGANQNNTAKE
eukprot:107753_1